MARPGSGGRPSAPNPSFRLLSGHKRFGRYQEAVGRSRIGFSYFTDDRGHCSPTRTILNEFVSRIIRPNFDGSIAPGELIDTVLGPRGPCRFELQAVPLSTLARLIDDR